MRICFYNVTATFISGGLETYCWEAGRALARRGHEVTIIAGNRGSAWHREARLVQFPFRAEKEWPDFGTRFRRLCERASFARHSLRHLVESGYDAVIVNKPFDFPILWQARRKGLAAQTVFRSGGTDFFPGDKLFCGAVDHWVSSSRHNAHEIELRYGRQVRVLYNGVDAAQFRPLPRESGWRTRRSIPEEALLVVSVGRLVGLKGHRVALEAMASLSETIHYLVVGEGVEAEPLRRRAADLGIAARVHFEGRVARENLPALLSEADLLLQPSIGAEAFGISVVEAMACGLPVFASDLGGLKETVIDGETGRLLAQGDVAEWRQALREAAAQRELLKRWGEAGRVRAQREFSWSANAEGLESMLVAGAH